MSTTYIFRIEGCAPDDIPIDRLGQYINNLAKLMRHFKGIHFQGLETGSTKLALKVDSDFEQRVAEQLISVKNGKANKRALDAEKKINLLLVKDKARGTLSNGKPRHDNIIRFPGRRTPQQELLRPFNKEGSLDGVLTSISGPGKTVYIQITDGELKYTGIETNRETACKLAKHMYQPLRIFGTGRWLRNEQGKWHLQKFFLDRFEPIKTATPRNLIDRLRAPGDFAWSDLEDPYGTLKALR